MIVNRLKRNNTFFLFSSKSDCVLMPTGESLILGGSLMDFALLVRLSGGFEAFFSENRADG